MTLRDDNQRYTMADQQPADRGQERELEPTTTTIAKRYVRDMLRRVARQAGLSDAVVNNLHPHVFRASCATIAAAAGAPLVEIQRLLGHADPRTTAGYTGRTGGLAASPVYVVAAKIAPGQAGARSAGGM